MNNAYQLTQDSANSLADLYRTWIETGDYEKVSSCGLDTGEEGEREDVKFTWESR